MNTGSDSIHRVTGKRILAPELLTPRSHLIGTTAGGALKPAPALSGSIVQQWRSAATTALSLTPGTIPDGALMIMAVFIQSDTDTISDVTGTTGAWTKVDGPTTTNVGGDFGAYLYMKEALGESGNYTSTKTGTEGASLMVLAVYTGADGVPTADFQKNITGAGGARQNAVLPAVTTTAFNTRLVYFAGFRGPGNTATPATGYTEILDTASGNAPNCEVAHMVQVAPTTTSVGSIPKVTSSTDCVYHVAISPA